MKFSVLLPTRNRLDLLKYAVESVRRQPYGDWEIIISDNCSEDDIAGYAASLNEPRIRYFRTREFIPVTDNWNNALDQATGDYFIMLGDDDALLPGYFTKAKRLIEEHDHPDVLYSSGYIYAYPGVIPDEPTGFLHRSGFAEFFRGSDLPFILDKPTAMQMIQHSLKLQQRFEYNMQYSTISRKIVESLKPYGPFFQSPFPDFYASNALFLKARILACPDPLVIIGISQKSYGFFHFNDKDKAGMAFLQCFPDPAIAERLADIILPGSNMNTSWLFAMEVLRQNFGREFDLPIDYKRYRTLQILGYHKARLNKSASPEILQQTAEKITFGEKLRLSLPISIIRVIGKRSTLRFIRRSRTRLGQSPPGWKRKLIPQTCTDILQAADFVSAMEKQHGSQQTQKTPSLSNA